MSSTTIGTESQHTMVIQRARGWASLGLSDLWEYRELLYYLGWRELQGAYRQTALGFSWVFLRPIISMVLLTFVFKYIVEVPSDGVPYPLFVLAALIPWTFFSNSVTRASRSLVDNMRVISKVYFPRMIIPIAGTGSGIVDYGASFLVFMVVFIYFRMPLRVEMLLLPVFTLVAFAFALAVGLWLATLSVKYRDVAFAVTFLLQALMYLSPVIYPVSMVPEQLQVVYQLNPMTGVIQGMRWSLLGSGEAPNVMFLISSLVVVVLLVSGAYVFRRTERTVVDIL
jgi:lipopolysaccharide transport system permease protein